MSEDADHALAVALQAEYDEEREREGYDRKPHHPRGQVYPIPAQYVPARWER